MVQDEQGGTHGPVLHLLLDRIGRLRIPFPRRIASEVTAQHQPDDGSSLGHTLELGVSHGCPSLPTHPSRAGSKHS